MKKILIILLNFNLLKAAIGCMDNSYHMKRSCDYKNYHYVRCECPCTDVIDEKGKCRRCYHRGNPIRGEINSLQLMEPLYILR